MKLVLDYKVIFCSKMFSKFSLLQDDFCAVSLVKMAVISFETVVRVKTAF